MAKKIEEAFWQDGFANYIYEDGTVKQVMMSEEDFLYDDDDEPREIYTEWMPRYGGYQPDDND